uniref:Aminomethyltransferase n=1 Tax=Nilaparvata lugens TaxID=108931 RepID=A0A1S6KZN3_NILLU|nr:putative aminomethyltransferase [Nilaparvata lugens]
MLKFLSRDSIHGFSVYSSLVRDATKKALLKYKVEARHAHAQAKTSLYDFHKELGGKFVNFGGYELPVQYAAEGIAASHLHTRASCSIFDVSHMLQTEVRGSDRIAYFESLCTADVQGLPENGASLSLFIDDSTGGILDDLIVTKAASHLFIVSNAGRRDHDSQLMIRTQDEFRKQGKDVTVRFLSPEKQSLLAIQGPRTAEILQPFTDIDLEKLYFMKSEIGTVCGIEDCRVSRCGYTGEDGVEISVKSERAPFIVSKLLKKYPEVVKMAGLGARDTLRIEAGLCLYGNDIDETVTPAQAGLGFTVAKRRRQMKDFNGAPIILSELEWGPYKKRVGLKSLGKGSEPAARKGAEIFVDNQMVGSITSGCPSPSLGYNIAMGYVKKDFVKPGTQVQVQIRDKKYDMEVCKVPFLPAKYYIQKKNKN